MADSRIREVRPGTSITLEALGFPPGEALQVRLIDILTAAIVVPATSTGIVEGSPGNYAVSLEIPVGTPVADYAAEWEYDGDWYRDEDVIRVELAPSDTSFIVSLEDFTPGQRYDDTPWIAARISFSEEEGGTYLPLATIALDPLDTDPENPSSRDFTVVAPQPAGWFEVTFFDLAGNSQSAPPVYFPDPGIRPALTDVGALIRARTKDANGNELGTFTADIRPTDVEAERVIDQALADVTMRVGQRVPDDLVDSGRYAVALRAAMLIELSYFPEQSADTLTAYQSLRLTYEEVVGKLVSAVQIRDLFAETVPAA